MTDFSPFNVKDELKQLSVEEIRQWQQQKNIPYSVAMYNVVRDFNLASVIRNACAFAFQTVYIIGWRTWDKRGAVGAHHYINIKCVPTFEDFIEEVGLDHIVGLELPEHYPTVKDYFVPVHRFKWTPGDCLLLGEENAGIPIDHLEAINHRVYIDQQGAMRSLNAATAAGIAMYHVSLQPALK